MQNKRNRKLSELIKKLRRSKIRFNSGMKRLNEASYEWDFQEK